MFFSKSQLKFVASNIKGTLAAFVLALSHIVKNLPKAVEFEAFHLDQKRNLGNHFGKYTR